jgi:hypothetical protein
VRVELRRIDDDHLLDTLDLEGIEQIPHPGRWLQHGQRSYLVLQRRHRYRLRNGCYELASVALQVKVERQPSDAHWWNSRWVIGDPVCRFNARSPLLRCAVLPEGPCERCRHFRSA